MTNKINVLKIALEKLKNGFYYNWNDCETCNCGLVLQSAGLAASDIGDNMTEGVYSWEVENGTCEITGLPNSIIRDKFIEIGFTKKDILELEKLSNPEIAKELGFTYDDEGYTLFNGVLTYDKKEHVINYLTEWIKQLEQ